MPKRKREGKFKKSTVAVSAVIILLFAAAAVAAVAFWLHGRDIPAADSQSVIYKKSDGTYLCAEGEKIKIDFDDDSNALITPDSKYLICTVPSAKVGKKYDLYLYTLTSSAKVKKGKRLLDYGVEKNFEYSSDKLYYSKQDLSTLAVTTYSYDLKKDKKIEIDFAIKDMYIPSQGETVYYTKNLNDALAVYSYTPSSGSAELMKPVKAVRFYDDGQMSELLFETGSYKEDESELFRVTSDKNPVQIATTVSSVLYDFYKPGGNLYYFVKKDVPTDWRGIIEDDMAQTDEYITEPDKKDYFFFFGISMQYSLDMEKYNEKLARDEIRSTLDSEINGELFADSYTLYVKTQDSSVQIADFIEKDNVFAVAALGEPKVIFKSTQIEKSSLKMSDITADLQSDGVKQTVDKAVEAVKSSVKKSGIQLSATGMAQPAALSAYDDSSAEFMFDGTDNLYVKVRPDKQADSFTLYRHTVSSSSVSAAEQIGTAVTNCKLVSDELWYQKSSDGFTTGDVYRYYQSKSEKIADKVYSFAVHSADNIVIYKNFISSNGDETADIYFWNGSKLSAVGEKCVIGDVHQTDRGLAFIKNASDDDKLCIYSQNKLAQIDSEVYNIIDY